MFQTLPKKSQDELTRHEKKPPQSTLDDIKENPWHFQKSQKFEAVKATRGEPVENDFKKYINKGKSKYFMEYECDKPISSKKNINFNLYFFLI